MKTVWSNKTKTDYRGCHINVIKVRTCFCVIYVNGFFIGWSVFTIFEQSLCLLLATVDYTSRWELYQFETISRGNYSGKIDFSVLFLYIFPIFTYRKIDGTVVFFLVYCQLGEGRQCKRRRIYLSAVCFFPLYVQNEMLCTKHIIVFSLGCCLVRYIVAGTLHLPSVEDNNIILVYFNVYIILIIVLVFLLKKLDVTIFSRDI